MKKIKMDLLLFAEGAAAAEAGAETGVADQGAEATVVYGVEAANDHPKSGTDAAENKAKRSFEDLIKGEYKADFDARVKGILDDRFKNAKKDEQRLKAHEPILQVLAERYGIKSGDPAEILKALEGDTSFYADEAARRGMDVKDLVELKRVSRENEALKASIDAANRQQEEDQRARALYADWMRQSEELQTKFPGFDLETEMKNADFVQAMNVNGMTLEKAFLLAHHDELIPQLMAITANKVEQKVVNNIKARQSRPAENGVSAYHASVIRKTDPSKLNDRDVDEVIRRVRSGENISFG
ncbi:MAG: hypothetical protein IJ043_03105 [Clostridia bacterium]|nr:hypothetical protein [Clostridia bacterium]